MSLTTLSHKYIGRFALPASTTSGSYSAINAALTSTAYADGSSRTAGVDSAWSCEVAPSSVASILTPASSSLGHKIICAGGAAGSPTMISPDTYNSSKFNIGLAKNAGSYVSWSNSNPFNAGQFSGYYGNVIPSNAFPTHLHIYETIDTLWIIHETSGGSLYFTVAGAIIDPESSNPSASEVDGKIYGILTTGANAGSIDHKNIATTTLMINNVSNNNCHGAIFSPGSSTMLTIERQEWNSSATNSNTYKNMAGEFVRPAIYFQRAFGGNWIGRFREVTSFCNGLSTTKFTISSQVSGYIIGSSTTSTSNTILLKA